MFDSFDIRRVSDNTIADINDEVDKLVCEHFKLEYNDKDYGHFLFTFEEEEKGHFGHFQKSISWAGLLHVIIYYTDVDYGRQSVYSLLGALMIMRKRYIHLPKCTEKITVELIEFLQEKGLYVFVRYNDGDKDLSRINPYNGHTMWKNETGIFESDERGVLLKFHPSMENLSIDHTHPAVYPCVRGMVIPEGIRYISGGFFYGSRIKEGIVFPSTLLCIGEKMAAGGGPGAFYESYLPDVALPQSLESIEAHTFMRCHFKSLTLSAKQLNQFPENCFAGTEIGRLRIPWTMEASIDNVKYLFFPQAHICEIEYYHQ